MTPPSEDPGAPMGAGSVRSLSDLPAPIRTSDAAKSGGRSFGATSTMDPRTARETVLASWVHVSDLHFGHGDAGHQWNQQRVLEELLLDAKELVRDGGVPPPDFIFVTGDIAFSGGARAPAAGGTEYTLASRWFRQLQEILEIPSQRVFVVPGNHDVDREADDDVKRLLRGVRAGEESIDKILQAPRELERLRGRMASYLAFAEDFAPGASDRFHGGLWWRQRVALAEGVSLRICGLNTALLSVDNQDQGKLRVSQRQLAELFVPTPGALELAVVLGHHPVTGHWLADERDTRGQLDRHAALHLFGHLHEADSEQARHGWGTGCLRIAAGAAHAEAAAVDSPPVSHGYNFGALVVLGSGDLVVRIWPRRWSPRVPRFVVDVDNTNNRRDYAEHRLPERYRIHRPAPKAGLEPGDVLGDRYRLVSDIGKGGVGQVWRADDLKGRETVAVKVLNPDGAEPDPGRRDGFFRGAQAIAGLKHPAIARIRDPRPDPEKRHGPYEFYVMDFIDAPNLGVAFRGAPRSDAETVAILLAIGDGVAAAHKQRVIHRDLKPSNILRDPRSGRVFIIDFDTAKDLGNLTMTRSGEGLASTYYASPEVLMSLNPPPGGAPRLDERADIFSLAVVGIFLRTGRNPSHFNMPQVIAAMECGPGLRRVLTRGCADSAAERYASAVELMAALRQLEVSDEEPTRVSKPPRPSAPSGDDARQSSPPSPRPPVQAPPVAAPKPSLPSGLPPATAETRQSSPPPATRAADGAGPNAGAVYVAIEVERPSPPALEVSSAPLARSRPSRRVMLQAGGVLLAGLVAVSFYMVRGDGKEVPVIPVPEIKADPNDGGKKPSPVPTPAPSPVLTPAPTPELIKCDDGFKAEGTACVPRCPDGTRFIKGTGEYVFTAKDERRDIADFCLDVTEVTVAAFREKASVESYAKSKTLFYSGASPVFYKYCNARREDREDHPMNCVDWEQASAHCESIGGRLPTEWEWEWAARGRDEGRKYPWGPEAPKCDRAIFSPGSVDGCRKDRTWPVGSRTAELSDSRDGLKDMSGNVWEWTSSIYNGNDSSRVLRGGGWGSGDAGNLRASFRNYSTPSYRGSGTGFRCARTTL